MSPFYNNSEKKLSNKGPAKEYICILLISCITLCINFCYNKLGFASTVITWIMIIKNYEWFNEKKIKNILLKHAVKRKNFFNYKFGVFESMQSNSINTILMPESFKNFFTIVLNLVFKINKKNFVY